MTLILRSPVAMTAPLPDTPRLPDITSNLYLHLRASDLMLADGAQVSSWLAQGAAPLADRTFAGIFQTGWSYPTFDVDGGPGGRPAVSFNGNNRISNQNDAAGSALANVEQPLTSAIVFRGTGGASARVLGGRATGTLHNVWPSVSGENTFSVSAGFTQPVNGSTADWSIVIVAFDGINTWVQHNGGALQTVNAGTNRYNGLALGGGGGGAANGTGLVGAIVETMMFTRKFQEGDFYALHGALAQKYGL